MVETRMEKVYYTNLVFSFQRFTLFTKINIYFKMGKGSLFHNGFIQFFLMKKPLYDTNKPQELTK